RLQLRLFRSKRSRNVFGLPRRHSAKSLGFDAAAEPRDQCFVPAQKLHTLVHCLFFRKSPSEGLRGTKKVGGRCEPAQPSIPLTGSSARLPHWPRECNPRAIPKLFPFNHL